MIVYADRCRAADTRPLLAQCGERLLARQAQALPDHEAAVELLLTFGELETALADALAPRVDAPTPAATALGHLALATGHLLRRAWQRLPADGHGPGPAALAAALRRLADAPLPPRVGLRSAEGYAFYGLYPETYLAAAERLAAELPPQRAVCIGLRGIGSSLSAVVAAGLEARGWQVRRDTVRPRGDPLARGLALAPALRAAWAAWGDAWFLLVDEGPGLSGSSLCGSAAALVRLGIDERRIVFFPSWQPDAAALLCPAARERWPRHRKLCVPFEALGLVDESLLDLSAGRWRALLYPPAAPRPAVQPQHERRKYLTPGPAPRLRKFAGLGHYGRPRLERAARLAAAGFAPAPAGLRHGFLESAFVPGTPYARATIDPPLLEHAARYLAFLARAFPAGRPAPVEENLAMVRENVGELLHAPAVARLGVLERYRGLVADVPALAGDGRMQPHEWIATASGALKTDATDHHDDHFFPGSQEVAWDVAGCAVEWGLDAGATRTLAERVATLSADRRLPTRLPFYRVAYLAYRLGYATLAARGLGADPDGGRFARLARHYRRGLITALAHLPQPRRP